MKTFNPKWLVAVALASGGALANEQAAQRTQAGDTARGTQASAAAQAGQKQSAKDTGAAKAASSRSAKDGGAADRGVQSYALLVVPLQVASDDRLNNGCWARVYENPNFGGSHLTIMGPIDVARLEKTVADDWNGADSLVTGSAATVTTYKESNFREQRHTYGPNQRAADLPSGPLEKVESLRVSCKA